MIGNVRNLPACVPPEAQVLVNGDTGEIILNPTEETLARHQNTAGGFSLQCSEPVAGLKVMANIERCGDVAEVLAVGAEGVGLYRTEMELLAAGRLLSEAEQTERYSEVVRIMARSS